MTSGMSPALLQNIINQAAIHAAALEKEVIERSDLIFAFEKQKMGIRKQTLNALKEERHHMATY